MKSKYHYQVPSPKNDSNRSIRRRMKRNPGVQVAINHDVFFRNLCHVTFHTVLNEGYWITLEK